MNIDDITQPFAVQGDRQDIPLDPTADNKLSWLSGFTYLYELKPEETDVEPYILRRDFNEIIYLITAKMLDIQTNLEADVGTALDTKLDKDEYYRDKPYFVTTNTTQTISAQKTFTGNIYFNKTPTGATQAVNKSYADTKVSLTGNQTIAGTKTFSSVPVCATQPNANNQLSNKQYVDTKVSLSGNQTIAGNKTFSGATTTAALTANGAITAKSTLAVTGNTTIAGTLTANGTATFATPPISKTNPSANNQLANKQYVDTKVALSGNQTISGLKTFATAPRSNTDPINNNDLVRLSYLKSNTPGLSGKKYIGIRLIGGSDGKVSWTNNTGRAVFFIYTITMFPEDYHYFIYFDDVIIANPYNRDGGIAYQGGIIVPNGTKISFVEYRALDNCKYLPL